jgi:hypothetical protein
MFPFSEHIPALLTWEQVIAVADLGMYSAKTLGRNRCIGVLAEADFSTPEDVDELLVKGLGDSVAHRRVALAT